MKKLTTILIALLSLAPLFSQAQESKFEIGVLGGPGLSAYGGFKDYSNHIAYSYGFKFQYNFHEHIGFNSGLFYEHRGERLLNLTTQWPGDPENIYSHFHYLTLPISLKFFGGKKNNIFFQTGPYLSALMSAWVTSTYGSNSGSRYLTGDFKSIDLGWTFGTGIDIKLSPRFFLPLEIRYNYGLLDLRRKDSENPGFPANVRHQGFQFMIGLTYHFNPKVKLDHSN